MLTAERIARVPEALRAERLDRLEEPQELYLEGLVARGAVYSLGSAGYAIAGGDGCLLELGLAAGALDRAPEALSALRVAAGLTAILAQSFDPVLVALGHRFGGPPQTVAVLYRRYSDALAEERADVRCAPGTAADVQPLADLGEFFDDAAEVEAYRALGGLWVYRDPAGALVGAGVMKRSIPGRANADLGMVVAPAFRRRGLGTHIIRDLKRRCLGQGLRPVCGCDVANQASRSTLERAGFAGDHRLLRFDLAGQATAAAR